MKNSNIEWTDHTFNPWIGCTKVSPGCDHCYAEARMDKRLHKVQWGPGNPRQRTSEKYWKEPTEWNKQRFMQCAVCGWRGAAAAPVIGCGKCGSIELDDTRARVFCASLADVFDNEVPGLWRQHLLSLVARTPNLDWLFLTKRIGNAHKMLSDASMHDGLLLTADDQYRPPANLWIGATITSQVEADRDIPKLLAVPAAKRFLSMEPLLGPVDLRLPTRVWENSAGAKSCDHCCNGDRCDDPTHYERGRPDWRIHCPHCRGTGRARIIDWVIVGGESGPGARPMHPDWARSLRDQCQAAGVPFLFKQWGEWLPGQNDVHPNADGRRVAHHQDGRWGPTNTKVNASNYLSWDASGMVHHGSLANDTTGFRAQVWAERIGKKAAGRMLDGRTWDEVPA